MTQPTHGRLARVSLFEHIILLDAIHTAIEYLVDIRKPIIVLDKDLKPAVGKWND